ncbi:hypothetical protein BTM175_08460 [Helicobacter pylori]
MKHQTTRYGEIPFYKIGTFGNTADAFISKKLFLEYKTKYSFPKKGDILISASGTIGRAVIYDGKPAYFQDSNIVWIDNDETLVKNDFLFYAYSNVKWNTEHTTILRLYNDNFRNTLIPLPPLNEQNAIANILSALDRYLCTLDALILKKEGVKKSLSFELLSQRKRLKGFNQAWQRVRLGDIAEIIGGGTPSTQVTSFWNGSINWFTPTEIGITKYIHKSQRTITPLGLKKSSTKLLPIGTILLTSRASIGDCAILKVVATTNQGFQSLIPLEKINNEFLYYLMLTLKNKLLKLASGSTFLEVSPNKIKNLLIPLPPLNEQIAIANILSALDKEIASLKNKKRQFENIKKALNHDLMSAKIRVLKK